MYQSKHNCYSNKFLLFRLFDIQHMCFGSDSSFSYTFMPAHTHYPYSGYGRNLSYFSVTGSRQKRPGPDWFQNRSDTDRLEWCKEFSNLTQQYSQPFVLHFLCQLNVACESIRIWSLFDSLLKSMTVFFNYELIAHTLGWTAKEIVYDILYNVRTRRVLGCEKKFRVPCNQK